MTSVDLRRYSRIVQYFWDPEPKNDDVSGSSIWCLGKEYTSRPNSGRGSSISLEPTENGIKSPFSTEQASQEALAVANGTGPNGGSAGLSSPESSQGRKYGEWPVDFLDDFESRIWMTYRSNFPPIKKSLDPTALSSMSLSVRLRSQLVDHGGFTSDTGWGCMIRSGQSLLANALVFLRLGRDWRRGIRQIEERQLLKLFADDIKAPFSIHRFVEHGASACGKHPGEWFGPSATARCIQALSEDYIADELKVYITGDGADVYQDNFFKHARKDDGRFTPTLILVGIRLGIDRVTPAYWDALKACLQMPQSIGIAGGRPSSSHYFVGFQGDNFFYLDPHQTLVASPLYQNLSDFAVEEIDSYHTRKLRRLPISKMDPSMLIAFLIRDETDWLRWKETVGNTQGKAVIHVEDTEAALHGHSTERRSAVDEVETFDDEEGDGEIIEQVLN